MKSIGLIVLAAGAAAVAFLFGKKDANAATGPLPPPPAPREFPHNLPPLMAFPTGGTDAEKMQYCALHVGDPACIAWVNSRFPPAPAPGSPGNTFPVPPGGFPPITIPGWTAPPEGPPSSGIPKPVGWPQTQAWPPPPPVYWPKNIPWPPVEAPGKPYGWPNEYSWPPAVPNYPPTNWPLWVPFPVKQ